MTKLFAILFTLCLCYSCTYNKKNEEFPSPSSPSGGFTDSITYTNFTKNIIDNNCISCHSSAGLNVPPSLVTYPEVKAVANAGRIKARVIDEIPTKMPPSGSLPQTVKDTLQIWLNQGFLE